MEIIEIPIDGSSKELLTRFEQYLTKKQFRFIRAGRFPDFTIKLEAETSQDAFWIGCNFVAICNKLYDGPLTTTG